MRVSYLGTTLKARRKNVFMAAKLTWVSTSAEINWVGYIVPKAFFSSNLLIERIVLRHLSWWRCNYRVI